MHSAHSLYSENSEYSRISLISEYRHAHHTQCTHCVRCVTLLGNKGNTRVFRLGNKGNTGVLRLLGIKKVTSRGLLGNFPKYRHASHAMYTSRVMRDTTQKQGKYGSIKATRNKESDIARVTRKFSQVTLSLNSLLSECRNKEKHVKRERGERGGGGGGGGRRGGCFSARLTLVDTVHTQTQYIQYIRN